MTALPQTLPPRPWADTPAGVALLAALDCAAGSSRLVGGAVRDALLGLPVKDIDLATVFAPEEVMQRLRTHGLKAVPTGLAHGTITAVGDGLAAEITTLRRDVATFGRHAEVAFTDDWREDASRRDFTINALYATLPGGAISDYFGGRDDLAAGRVRFIGDPLARIAEDHLRILRFFRFSARFAGVIDEDGLAACAARANDLMALSRERIAMEIKGLLETGDPLPTLALMLERGVLSPVLPEITSDRLAVLARTIAAETQSGVPAAWQRRLAALLPPACAPEVTARLRLSNADRARLVLAVQPMPAGPATTAAYRDGTAVVVDRLLMAGDAEAAAGIAGWQRPRPPASGKDIISRGIAPGPDVTARFNRFERAWVAAGFPVDAAAVAALLDEAAR
ncbi:CCA tRNA nucleotidyltransferase [Sandarakinorhabdus sp.]|uniref:CCA tRNA nucleotidyltransferase n=1 Tax=Sandarakinorhabdus sp. TaxID=1916663 RepID=UPI00286EAB38|nr:CCA tRNA nucleotidyltransferase [Sandarakinorhabdus sp.]